MNLDEIKEIKKFGHINTQYGKALREFKHESTFQSPKPETEDINEIIQQVLEHGKTLSSPSVPPRVSPKVHY